MTEHTPVPYGYFQSQESRFFQAEKWAITGPEHDHEESWDIVADGIPDEATAKFIVTACNCHADLLDALERMDGMLDMLCKKINWETSFLDADTLREFNEAPIQAKQIIRKVKEQSDESKQTGY